MKHRGCAVDSAENSRAIPQTDQPRPRSCSGQQRGQRRGCLRPWRRAPALLHAHSRGRRRRPRRPSPRLPRGSNCSQSPRRSRQAPRLDRTFQRFTNQHDDRQHNGDDDHHGDGESRLASPVVEQRRMATREPRADTMRSPSNRAATAPPRHSTPTAERRARSRSRKVVERGERGKDSVVYARTRSKPGTPNSDTASTKMTSAAATMLGAASANVIRRRTRRGGHNQGGFLEATVDSSEPHLACEHRKWIEHKAQHKDRRGQAVGPGGHNVAVDEGREKPAVVAKGYPGQSNDVGRQQHRCGKHDTDRGLSFQWHTRQRDSKRRADGGREDCGANSQAESCCRAASVDEHRATTPRQLRLFRPAMS